MPEKPTVAVLEFKIVCPVCGGRCENTVQLAYDNHQGTLLYCHASHFPPLAVFARLPVAVRNAARQHIRDQINPRPPVRVPTERRPLAGHYAWFTRLCAWLYRKSVSPTGPPAAARKEVPVRST